MYRFIETIRLEEGKAWNMAYHNRRLNETRFSIWGDIPFLSLEEVITPQGYKQRTRCRVVYGKDIEDISYIPYSIRPVSSLKLVYCDDIDYALKRADRSVLDSLFALRGEMDDILIVRNGKLTDTSIANIALWNGKEWHTPSCPLLKGTCRQSLLDHGLIREKDVTVDDLTLYSKIRLFNAMLPFGEIELDCSRAGTIR